MYLRRKGTLVCVGMPAGNALLNIPVALLVAKVNEIDIPLISYYLDSLSFIFSKVHDYCGISDWVNFYTFPTLFVLALKFFHSVTGKTPWKRSELPHSER